MGQLIHVRNGGRTPEQSAGNGLGSDLREQKECHPWLDLWA